MNKSLIVAMAITMAGCAPMTPEMLKDSNWEEAVHHRQYTIDHNIGGVYEAYNEMIQGWDIAWMWNNPARPAHFDGKMATISVDYRSVMTHHFQLTSTGENETEVEAWQYLGQNPDKCGGWHKYTIQCVKETIE